MEFQSKHNLSFEVADYLLNLDMEFPWLRFKIGTCTGLWRCKDNSYEILSIDNSVKGNGHLSDVFDWFENSCKRDSYSLKVLEFCNQKFKKHLIEKKGFKDHNKNHVIKNYAKM